MHVRIDATRYNVPCELKFVNYCLTRITMKSVICKLSSFLHFYDVNKIEVKYVFNYECVNILLTELLLVITGNWKLSQTVSFEVMIYLVFFRVIVV